MQFLEPKSAKTHAAMTLIKKDVLKERGMIGFSSGNSRLGQSVTKL